MMSSLLELVRPLIWLSKVSSWESESVWQSGPPITYSTFRIARRGIIGDPPFFKVKIMPISQKLKIEMFRDFYLQYKNNPELVKNECPRWINDNIPKNRFLPVNVEPTFTFIFCNDMCFDVDELVEGNSQWVCPCFAFGSHEAMNRLGKFLKRVGAI